MLPPPYGVLLSREEDFRTILPPSKKLAVHYEDGFSTFIIDCRLQCRLLSVEMRQMEWKWKLTRVEDCRESQAPGFRPAIF